MNKALKELLYKMADDQLVLGHRNSEWTGVGPLLEEDIAFSSMAQDKVGQSYQLYQMLHQLGEQEPDTVAFMRNAGQFHNSQFVELPVGEYDFSLIRHFLFDHAEFLRFGMLSECSHEPLAQLARKIRGELKYHVMHANTLIKQLGTATEESVSRLQQSLEYALPYALGIFEKSPYEDELIQQGIFAGEAELQKRWAEQISKALQPTALQLPSMNSLQPITGGRRGQHTQHLQPLLDEMAEVFKIDPAADW
ncbi:1,2-phenylacetyl-CoA epoxidase subunit PaaC [Cesiribacter sp. SM1]|uniref:1,2-phenylacetyl-CoA epoxidase subunit PaaC n=1 Tax=Cesiribacter sp. SM1 TaxID=2861196 RepID=UPI001CD56563|nr:1,2-phenylacetyl-CoA epoxidase subunit PaaC [Cesiribacter sp. SM1]